jgi:LacI family transcriptional regulator
MSRRQRTTPTRSAAHGGAATIREVAARAGVSVATVSRAINGNAPVQEETAKRVKAAVKALKYVPHAAARSLSIRRSHTIGVMLPDVHGEFFSEVIRGIDVAARARGYHILVSSSHADIEEMSAMLRALRGRVDGLILMSPDLELGAISKSIATDTPVVLLNSAATGRRTIRIDNYTGARAMTDHLIALGHTNIAFITGPERNVDAAERLRGYRSGVGSSANAKRPQIEVAGDFTEESGHRAAAEIIAMKPRPTAIFASNDAMALGALGALRDAGLRVPDDVALAGFDDVPIARYLTPRLTTVKVDIAELGRRAVESLVNSLGGAEDKSKKVDVIPTTLVVRESCGAATDSAKPAGAKR